MYLKPWLIGDEGTVDSVRLLQPCVNGRHSLVAIFVVLDGINSAAGSRCQRVVKLGVFAEPAAVAQERVFLVVVDRPVRLMNVSQQFTKGVLQIAFTILIKLKKNEDIVLFLQPITDKLSDDA